jgi:hypothetical protein
MALTFRDAQLGGVDVGRAEREEARRVMDLSIAVIVDQHVKIQAAGGVRSAPALAVVRYSRTLELTVLFLRDMVLSAPRGAVVVRFPKAIWDDIITIGGDRLVPGFDHNAVADALIAMRNAEALCVGVDGENYTSPDAWCQQSWFDSFVLQPTVFHYVYEAVAYLFWTITDGIKARIAGFRTALEELGVKIEKFDPNDLWAAYSDYLVIAAVVLGIGATLYLLPQIKAALSPLTYKP